MNDWKDFFYLSIGERRALILLLILIAIGLYNPQNDLSEISKRFVRRLG